MNSFRMMNPQTCQVGSTPQAAQVAPRLSQSSYGAWTANTTQQYMGNSGVQGLQSTNFTLKYGTSKSRQMTTLQSPDPTWYKGNSMVEGSQSSNFALQNAANHGRQMTSLQRSDTSHYVRNSGVQVSQSANFALQNRANHSRPITSLQSSDSSHVPAQFKEASNYIDNLLLKMIRSQPHYTLNKFQNENVSVSTACVPGSATMRNSHQLWANQSLPSTVDRSATFAKQNTANFYTQSVSFNEEEMNRTKDVSHLQQHRVQQAMHGAPNGGTNKAVSSYTSTPLICYAQMVNSNVPGSAAVCNSKTPVGTGKIHRPSFSESGYAQNYSPSSQASDNNCVATQQMPSNQQSVSASNVSQITRQPSDQCSPSYNNCGGFGTSNSLNRYQIKGFQMKKLERSLSHDTALQQLPRQNIHAENTDRSYASHSNPPPPYKDHFLQSQTAIKKIQTMNVASSEIYSLNASQTVPLCSTLPVSQSFSPPAQQKGNVGFQHNLLPNTSNVSKERNVCEGGQVVSIFENVSQGCPVESRSVAVQECERVIWQRNKPPAMVVSRSNNVGMPPSFKQNDSCASSMSSHPSTKAIAVVPPLSQEECHSPTTSEPCTSVDDAQKKCISTIVPTISETTFVRGDSNQNQVTPNEANDEAVLTILDSETESLAQTTIQNNQESIVEGASEVSLNQNCTEEQTESDVPRLPPIDELSLLPTKSWTAGDLRKLILEMDKAQPKPKDNSKYSTIIKILMMPWNKNLELFNTNHTDCQSLLSDTEKFCETHIKQDTVVLKQVSPDFKDQLKRYIVLKDYGIFPEPPYKSLWLNVNDQLDDIDKEFGFPLALKRHIAVHETESQGQRENNPEPTVEEGANKVLFPAKSESVGMVKESQICQTPPASPQESSEKSVCESSYSFKIEVLPPEEAKLIYDQIQPEKKQSCIFEKETIITGSGKKSPTLNDSKLKESLDNQLKEICCLTRFVEMNTGSHLSSQCKCGSERNANEDTINTLKRNPDHLSVSREDVNFQTNPSNHLTHIIDLTDDDDHLLSFFDNKPEPIFQMSICSRSNAVAVCDQKDKVISSDFSSLQDLQSLVIKNEETGREHVQDEFLKESVQSSNSMCCTQLTIEDSNNIRTKEPVLFSNQEKNHEEALITFHDEVKSPSENKTQLQVSDANKQKLNISVCNAGDEKRQDRQKEKRQRSLEHYFHSLKKPKVCRLPVDSDSDHTSEAQSSFSEEKTLELVLFGQQEASSPSKKDKRLVSSPISYEKHKPPGVLSLKLGSSGRDITKANTSKDCSVKQKIYEKWKRSVPTMNRSVGAQPPKILRRQNSLPASSSSTRTKEEKQTVSPELRLSDKTMKYILSLKKRRALSDCRRREAKKRMSYSVTIEEPEHQKGREMENEEGNGMLHRDGIVLKFSVLPNTFNFTGGPSEMQEETKQIPDDLKPVEKDNVSEKPAKKLKVRAWYPSEAKQHKPVLVHKNVSLFDEYRKKYKEKTLTSMDE